VAFVAQNNVHDLSDSTCFIYGSINVVDRDRGGEAMGGDVVRMDILCVNE
jgi:hypothetical protein